MIKVVSVLFCILLTSCGPGVGDYDQDLGGGYFFSHTSSIGRMVLKGNIPRSDIIVDTVVLDYYYDGNYIILARLPSVGTKCKFKMEALKGKFSFGNAFIDRLEYLIIEKKSATISTFLSELELKKHLKELKFTKNIDLDISDKEQIIRRWSVDQIDKQLCKKLKENALYQYQGTLVG